MNTVKSWIALLLVLVMLCTFLPIQAVAAADVSARRISADSVNSLYIGQAAPKLDTSSENVLTEAVSYFHIAWDVVENLREGMEKRWTTIKFGYSPYGIKTEEEMQAYAYIFMEEALKHTGVPTEGDYLRWQCKSWSVRILYHINNNRTYITYEYTFDYYTDAGQEWYVTKAVQNLIDTLDMRYKFDYQKVRAVYDYLCANVEYDHEAPETDDDMAYTAYGALINGKAERLGYALLFYRVMLELHIDCRVIVGVSSDEEHVWNIVKLSGQYYNLDSAWDAIHHQTSLPYKYFLKTTANFDNHTRYDYYDTDDFHMAHPMADVDYPISSPNVPEGDENDYCGEKVRWQLVDGTLTVSGEGPMTMAPWQTLVDKQEIRSLVIGEGVTAVCVDAFKNCKNLETISLPTTLTLIDDYAFSDCTKLSAAILPNSVYLIGDYAFLNCYNMVTLQLPDGLKTIGKYTFQNCASLYRVDIPEGTQIIGKGAFQSASYLNKIELPDSVTHIGNGIFKGCTALQSAKIGKGITAIADDTFWGCRELLYVTIPNTVTEIGTRAFADCKYLKAIYYEGRESEWLNTWCGDENTYIFYAQWYYAEDWEYSDGHWYLYEYDVLVTDRWAKDSVGWVYLGPDGAMLTNRWVQDSKGWCYVGANGYAVTNCWKKDSVGWCYLDKEGSQVKNNWVLDGGKWYFIDADGYMVYNKWIKDSKGWVYLGSSGAMLTNAWCKDSKGWCYVGANGYAVTNCWKKDSVGWCYLDKEGSQVKNNWVKDGGKWYYIDGNGYMVANKTVTVKGKAYRFDAGGVCLNP